MTVHQAMRVLRDEGLVESWQGRGVFVRADGPPPRTADLSAEVADVRRRVDDLAAQVSKAVSTDVADLRRQVGALQAHLMELYARTGQPYPHDTPQADASTGRRRKASGS
jgi:DNA-binding GntR family transcriptional regulator